MNGPKTSPTTQKSNPLFARPHFHRAHLSFHRPLASVSICPPRLPFVTPIYRSSESRTGMEPSMPNAIGSSIVMESCISGQSPPRAPPTSKNAYALEINLISAQDLSPITKSMQPYAAAWIDPNRKHITQVDQQGHKNPKWNEKFTFRLKNDLPEDAEFTVEIYTLSWFRDVLVGTVIVPIQDLVEPLAQSPPSKNNVRFITLQIRAPSGAPQGILNIGVALRDSATTMKSMPLQPTTTANNLQPSQHGIEHPIDEHKKELISKIEMWRSMSTGSGLHIDDFTNKPGSIVNGSMCDNGSELCSDIGPSASIVAVEMAMKMMPPLPPPRRRNARNSDDSSSILEDMTLEQAQAKGYTKDRRKAAAAVNDGDDSDLSVSSKRSEGSLFSCFAGGIEFTIVCGSSKKPSSKKQGRKN